MSRASLYTDELGEKICDLLAAGESLVDIADMDGMPGLRTMMRWSRENETFGTWYAHAREAQAEFMDHKIVVEARVCTPENAAAARVKIGAYQWRAAKLAPKRYGDKVDVTSGGEVIQTAMTDDDRAARIAALVVTVQARLPAPNDDAGD